MPKGPTNSYTPKGKMLHLLGALQAEPDRTFTGAEAAVILGVSEVRVVASFVFYADRAGLLFKRVVGSGAKRQLQLRGTPFPPPVPGEIVTPAKPSQDKKRQTWKEGGQQASVRWATDPDDPRIGKVVQGWKPPVMRHVRGGQ